MNSDHISSQHIAIVGGWADSLIRFRGPLIAAMMRAGHRVTACAPDAPPDVRAALVELGATYRHVSLRRASLTPLVDLQTLLTLRRLFRQIRPDKVLCYTIKPVIYGSLAARWARVPESFSMITGLGYAFSPSGETARFVSFLARNLYRVSLATNRKVFFQNPDDLERFRREGIIRRDDQPILINGSGVDLEHFRPVPLSKQPVFLMIARLLKAKGVREYVEAARRVKQRHPEASFRLVGWIDAVPDAISAADLRAWIAEGVIQHVGRIQDVRPELERALVYVLPSYAEGTPRTVLEAMAMGRPIITTDAPGCRETVRPDQNGWLVPARNVDALVETMLAALADRPRLERMGRRSREIAEEKYDVHKVNAVILSAMRLMPITPPMNRR